MNEPQNILTGRVTGPPPLIDGHALGDLLRQHTSWAAVPASIPPVVTVVAWSLLICDAAVTAWLTGVQPAVRWGARARCAKWRRCPGIRCSRCRWLPEAWCPWSFLLA